MFCYNIVIFFYFKSRFFFLKQKTEYEMRISDLSSDVCSSYLVAPLSGLGVALCAAATMRAPAASGAPDPTSKFAESVARSGTHSVSEQTSQLSATSTGKIARTTCRESEYQFV